MVGKCIVKNCNNSNSVSRAKPSEVGFAFHRFPSSAEMTEVWKKRLNLSDSYVIDKNDRVCSQHFHHRDIVKKRCKTKNGFRQKWCLDRGAFPMQQHEEKEEIPIVSEVKTGEILSVDVKRPKKIKDKKPIEYLCGSSDDDDVKLEGVDEIKIEVENDEEIDDADDPIGNPKKPQPPPSVPSGSRENSNCPKGCTRCDKGVNPSCPCVEKLMDTMHWVNVDNEKLRTQVAEMKKKVKILQQRLRRREIAVEKVKTNLKEEIDRKETALDRAMEKLPETTKPIVERMLQPPGPTGPYQYGKDLKRFAIELRAISKPAYKYVRQELGLNLPHLRTLTRWKNSPKSSKENPSKNVPSESSVSANDAKDELMPENSKGTALAEDFDKNIQSYRIQDGNIFTGNIEIQNVVFMNDNGKIIQQLP